jgi:hypothetical protein
LAKATKAKATKVKTEKTRLFEIKSKKLKTQFFQKYAASKIEKMNSPFKVDKNLLARDLNKKNSKRT